MEGDRIQKDVLRPLFLRPRPSFSLRMAPLIDLVFLMLIFFLVAVKWRPQEDFLPLKLPAVQAQTAGIGRPEPLRIYISSTREGCFVKIGQIQTTKITRQSFETDLVELMKKMEEVMIAQGRVASDPIEIICEPDVKSEYWIRICNVFYGMKITDITFPMTQWQDASE